MNNNSKLLGFYNYTVVLTYIGMIVGFIGITYVLQGNLYSAVICLMITGFCDMFDGAIASTMVRTKQEKCFGIQIDSFSDLICFGVLPAAMACSIDHENIVVAAISSLYVLSALIRLAYFNVDEQDRQESDATPREIYYGLPVTLAAVIIPIAYGIGKLTNTNLSGIMSFTLAVMAMAFLIPFKLRKPRIIGKICVVICGLAEVSLIVISCGDI